ncbi:alpha-hydroxy acid oxidase [Flavisphingomonas formosensis]|uniref:alpha-hydroxy acid oxidase n=1 Tax=Flavisphingomonas formosensis TaxID=861534 RepID=UPI0012F8C6E4|nr:alpha-hydroxy acid oxidase [Sphingomonas formosensis]
MRDSEATCIEHLRERARRSVPRMFYDYVDAGSWSEATYRANARDLAALCFRQRVAVNIAGRHQGSTMAGRGVTMPVALAPVGFAGMVHGDGEILAARAAESFGVPFTLSTVSICSIEDVAAHTSVPFWFQLYIMKDRAFVESLVGRAKRAGCSALVLTLDLPMQGLRHKDLRNGLSAPPRLGLRSMIAMARRPRWCAAMLATRRRTFGNIVGHASGVEGTLSFADWVSKQFDPSVSWDDVRWLRGLWGGKLILKGIMDVEDARKAVEVGADVVVVSNHGGRQLDGAPSSISALPSIVEAVGDKLEIWLDGGITSGQDALKALALGARGTMIGRAFLYGLGAHGQAGVRRSLEIIQREMDLTMALCGMSRIDEIDRSMLTTRSLAALGVR